MASSSSSSVILESKNDVFLSFRGEDTRHNFTGHLYAALCREKVAAFIDDDGLKRGDEISPLLLKAIEDSKISVIIFSKDYGSSRWCLDELAKIIECRTSKGQIVVPVFYHIDPSDIRKQTGSYRKALIEHAKRFKNMPERVQMWRAALTEAANLSGYHLTENRSESKLVEEIVRDILKKLIEISPLSDNCDDLVGMDERIEQVNSLLLESKLVGIWGMGGIGKTTIAEALFKRISGYFDCCCFINVGKQLEKHHDQLVDLQREIISRILGEGNHVIDIPDAIPQLTKERLQRKKIFLILDDVNDFKQLKLLIRGLEPLHAKSRIIITTRDKQVLSCCDVNHIYEVAGLNYDEASLLFCKCAFKKNHAPEHLEQLSNVIISYAKGSPLALQVLGSFLCGKSKEAWESVMHDLKVIADPEILDVLKISYKGLNYIEKNMFLDIACFLNWENEHDAKKMLKACYEPMEYCLEVLINKALIKISNMKLQMHDLLQEMGKEIVLKECKDNPGKRSRLWDEDDVYHVLQNHEGTGTIKGIFLDMSRLRKEIHLSPEAFVNMINLRVLKLYRSGNGSQFEDYANISKECLPWGLVDLPNELRYLHWDGYPWDELPSKFSAEKLVDLKLPYSKLQKLWDGAKHVINLKSIDVSNSEYLIEFPNLQNASKLESIKCEGCKRLLKVPSYIQYFTNLSYLNMWGCEYLRSFPRNIKFQSPITLNFVSCVNLTEFPKVLGNVKHLYLGWTAIEEVPASIECLTELVTLRMNYCEKLKSISPNICKLSSLSKLDLEQCFKLKSFPEIKEEMKHLKMLNLTGTAVRELPSSIDHLVGLTSLDLSKCENLESIPSSISNLLYLEYLSITRTAIRQLPFSTACGKVMHGLCLCLETLDLSGHDFESLPSSMKQLSKLSYLGLSNCNMLQSIPELPLRIQHLYVRNCSQLQSLPQLPSAIERFDEDESPCVRIIYFNFDNCLNLIDTVSRQRVEHMATALGLFYERVLDKIPDFDYFLPGSEIPEWFNNQSFGSSITIELPQQYCGNRRLIGFALSAVISGEKNHFGNYVNFHCDYSYANYKKHVPLGTFASDSIESDHIGISFFPVMDMILVEGHSTTVTFEFSIFAMPEEVQKLFKLKCCGVCPIYEEPNISQSSVCIERFASIDEDIEERMSVDSFNARGSGGERLNEEEVEPHPKRNCIDPINSSIMGGLLLSFVGLFKPRNCAYGSPTEGCKVKYCGVHQLDAEPNVGRPSASNELFDGSSEDLEKTATEDSSKRKFHEIITGGSEIGKSNEEEVEPHPKRICKTQTNPSLKRKILSSIKTGFSRLFRQT